MQGKATLATLMWSGHSAWACMTTSAIFAAVPSGPASPCSVGIGTWPCCYAAVDKFVAVHEPTRPHPGVDRRIWSERASERASKWWTTPANRVAVTSYRLPATHSLYLPTVHTTHHPTTPSRERMDVCVCVCVPVRVWQLRARKGEPGRGGRARQPGTCRPPPSFCFAET